jgi:hypothetical protein
MFKGQHLAEIHKERIPSKLHPKEKGKVRIYLKKHRREDIFKINGILVFSGIQKITNELDVGV